MSESLQSLSRAFAAFRGGPRLSRGRRYPASLRARAVAALQRHTSREIARALEISDARVIDAWQAAGIESSGTGRETGSQADFIELSRSPAGVDVELTGPHGVHLRLTGIADISLVRALAEVVVGRGDQGR